VQGSIFGAPERLLGYECDGVVPGVSPADVIVLAKARLQEDGTTVKDTPPPWSHSALAGAQSLTQPTTDWPRVVGNLSAESYPAVSQITRNVFTGCLVG